MSEKMTLTQRKIAEMLKENTGIAMCDSGFENGRHWQRNQGRDFMTESPSTMRAFCGDIEMMHNVFYWLDSRLEYDPQMNRDYKRFAALEGNERSHHLTLIELFPSWIAERRDLPVTGLYGDTDRGSRNKRKFSAVYTYNHENCLSQDVQFVYFELDGDPYVLLQIHNGADARGGMTDPKAFKIKRHCDSSAMYYFADAYAGCDSRECRACWDSDNGGYRWHSGDCGVDAPDLHNLTIIQAGRDDSTLAWYLGEMWKLDQHLDFEKIARVYGDESILYALEDGRIVCPVCGRGTLESMFSE